MARGRPFQKGNPGRPLGSKNKVTRTIRDGVLEAFHQTGDVEGLVKWAKRNRTEFYRMCRSLIPTEMVHSGAVALPVVEKIRHEPLTNDKS